MDSSNIIKTSAVAVFLSVLTGLVVRKLVKRKYLKNMEILRSMYHHDDDEDYIF